jgi:hypothetical protein
VATAGAAVMVAMTEEKEWTARTMAMRDLEKPIY